MKLTDVVDRINGNVDRFTTDLEYYIGGEHFESNELEVTQRGLLKENLGKLGFKFHFAFQDRDVVFMARNPHLRKAGMVRFAGLCSDASYILRSKDESVLSQEYLAVMLQSDHFWDYCESHKVGSVNFANNWSSIANYEFELPSAEKQKEISDKVWAAYRLKESYKKLLAATEEMVKSRFIEMFGAVESTKPLTDFIEVSFPGEWGQEDKDGSGVKVIRTTNFTNIGKLDLSDVVTRDIDSVKVEKKKLSKGDIILERSGGTNENPVGRVVYFEEDGVYLFNNFTQLLRCKEGVNSLFIFYSLFNYYQMNKNVIRSMGNKTTGIQNLKMDRYWQIPIADVSIERQKEFESIYRQADKSVFDGRKSRFIEMFGNPVTNNKQWPAKPISKVAPEQPSETKTTGSVWLLNLDMIESNTGKIIEKNYEDDSKLLSVAPFDEGNVLYSKLRPYLNKVVIPDGKGYATTELVPLRPNQELVNLTFFSHLLRGDGFVSYANGIATGTKMPRMPLNDLRKFNCILPPIQMQKEFEVIALQADKSVSDCYIHYHQSTYTINIA